MRKTILLFSILIQTSWAGSGLTTGFEFLKTDFYARSAAMAGSYLTLNGDLNALFINPAGMADLQEQNYSFNYSNYLLDINGGSAAYNRVFPKIGVLSVGVQYMNYGDFDRTDEDAVATGGTFSAHDFALVFGLANHLSPEFSYGVNVKYIFSKIDAYTASALALDFGLK